MGHEKIVIDNIDKEYDDCSIYENFSIEFNRYEVNCILGKSGCGKSTLLNIISDKFRNDKLFKCNIENRKIGYIFQEDRLIEWLTVEENIKLVLRKHYKGNEMSEICKTYLNKVKISEYENYYPKMLSGGIRQRVNIARALAHPCEVLLMDEPFKSIDIKNKKLIIDEVKELLIKDKKTVLFVTHDIEEALHLGNKIIILGDRPVRIKGVLDNNKKEVTKEMLISYI